MLGSVTVTVVTVTIIVTSTRRPAPRPAALLWNGVAIHLLRDTVGGLG